MNYDERTRLGGAEAIRDVDPFFAGTGPVHVTLLRIAANLDRIGVPYAICGAMALNAHGYRRMTIDVDVMVTTQGLLKAREELLALDYERTEKRIRYVPLPALIEAKLALGAEMLRIKHLGDVQEMIKHAPLPRDL